MKHSRLTLALAALLAFAAAAYASSGFGRGSTAASCCAPDAACCTLGAACCK